MPIQKIKIENFRNLLNVQLIPSGSINYISGDNGSGKTSVLESIYMVGRGRSFRTNRIDSVIRRDSGYLQVFAETKNNDSLHKIGIRKDHSNTLVKIDGKIVQKLSDIAFTTPVQLLTPKSHEMLERGPEYRRRFIEWGVFHVEHRYKEAYRAFKRVLNQRNADLRQGGPTLSVWNREFVSKSELLNQYRSAYFELLQREFDRTKDRYGLDSVTLAWKRGWSKSSDLEEVLLKGAVGDKKMGYTHSGPHRADIEIVTEGVKASSLLSRGQQKMLIFALTFAQARLLQQVVGQSPILLMDDLASELDAKNRLLVLESIKENRSQCFITGTETGDWSSGVDKVFHVEHGEIRE